MKQWLTAKEAKEYFGISRSTLYAWRVDGRFTIKESYHGNRFGYLYKRDDALRDHIQELKNIDNRWNK